jgi:hypothetical protein
MNTYDMLSVWTTLSVGQSSLGYDPKKLGTI